MAEYIEREAVVRELNKTYDNMNAMGAQFYSGFMNAVYRIKDFPAADVAPVVHGRWEWLGPNRLVTDCMCGTCSACKVRSKYIVNTMLCPNCGAKMDG